MKTVELEIGSPEWQSAFTASKAAAMMGVSKYQTRSELVRQMATGISKEVDAQTQSRFDRGHEIEAIARTFAEEEMDLDIDSRLEPITYAGEFDGITLFASLDGQFLPNNWECKSLNDELRESLAIGVIPDRYHPQMEQGLMVSDADSCLFTASDGTREGTMHAWYKPNIALRKRIIAGWKQLAEDVANYQHVEVIPAAVAVPQMGLPSVFIQVQGSIALIDNLDVFGGMLTEYIARINKKPETDQEFANLEAAAKTLKRAEEELDAAENSALGQAVSIDNMRKTVALYRSMARDNRLLIEKLVKAEKENRRGEILTKAKLKMFDHTANLNRRLGDNWMPVHQGNFAESIKGLKSLDSMREKIDNALRDAMFEASEIADRIESNSKALTDAQGNNWNFLFHDFGQVCTKQEDDFAALVAMRSGQHRAENEKRQEAERAKIRAEELANAQAKLNEEAEKIRAEERAKAQKEQDSRDDEMKRRWALEQDRLAGERAIEAANVEKRAANESDALQHGFGPVKEITDEEKRAVVVENQDPIAKFIASRDFKAEVGKVRAILVEYEKFKAALGLRMAA